MWNPLRQSKAQSTDLLLREMFAVIVDEGNGLIGLRFSVDDESWLVCGVHGETRDRDVINGLAVAVVDFE